MLKYLTMLTARRVVLARLPVAQANVHRPAARPRPTCRAESRSPRSLCARHLPLAASPSSSVRIRPGPEHGPRIARPRRAL